MLRRFLIVGVLGGSLLAAFAVGVVSRHYQTFPWPWLELAVQKTKALALRAGRADPDDRAGRAERIIPSVLLNLDLVIHNSDRPIEGAGGGLAATEDGVLIARAQDGTLVFYDKATQELRRIGLKLPENGFAALPDTASNGASVDPARHRYNDIAFLKKDGGLSLVVSYTYFHADRACSTNRLAARDLKDGWNAPAKTADAAGAAGDWQIVFETKPCVPLYDPDYPKTEPFSAHEAGGRIAVGADGFVYLTVGDFAFKGEAERSKKKYSLNPNSHYGKTIRIDPQDWSATIVSSGHKNPQGIAFDGRGSIWTVEHGPQGGDELNLIKPGSDYGWPYETLGVKYGDGGDRKYSYSEGRHDTYERPVYAWLPSIGVSNLKQMKDIHPRWDGDLVASSLKAQSLHRIRLDGDHVVYVEQIPVEGRVRYVEAGAGELYLLFDDGRFATLRPRSTEAPPGPRD